MNYKICRDKRCLTAWALFSLLFIQAGCRTPAQYRIKADIIATDIISAKQKAAIGKTEPFKIERPSDILRRRLLEQQKLAHSSPASLGTDRLAPIEHWPEPNYPEASSSDNLRDLTVEPNKPVRLTLVQALQVGASNSLDYQTQKENVFRTALSLDLTRNTFRNIFTGGANTDLTTYPSDTEQASGADVGVTRRLKNGINLSASMAISLVKLLTHSGTSSMGVNTDASISIPLMRGSGEYIAAEPLTQAERNVIYELWNFERYKRTFAVNIARSYYTVLRQMDAVANAREDYRSAVSSTRWSSRWADAGRIREIDVDQAVQRQLSARNGWITAQEQLKSALDSLKDTLGLPTDALIEVDPNELVHLRGRADEILEQMRKTSARESSKKAPPADAPVELVPASYEDAGPLEIPESEAVKLALDHRLDLQVALGGVYDAQRQVVVAADQLKGDLTLGGTARISDTDDVGKIRFDQGTYAALITLDLPIERTRERNIYRNSLIDLERATRGVQSLENQIKLALRNELRNLLEFRETLKIQAQSVVVAEKRVKSTTLFLEAGRAQIRDLLEAQDSLLSALNGLTRAVVDYRTAELELQRDLGLLEVNEKGLWREFTPEVMKDAKQQDGK